MAKTSAEQALSRIYAISRGLVAPEYTKEEAATAANKMKNLRTGMSQSKAKGGSVRKMAKGGTAKKKK